MMNNILWFPFIAALGFFAFVVAILIFAFWVWMIVDCAKRNFKNSNEKIIWIIVMALFTWVASLVYYITISIYNPRGLSSKKG